MAAAQQDVSHRLSSLSTVAPHVMESRNAAVEEKVFEADLLSPHLHEQSTLCFAQFGMELENLLGWDWCVSAHGLALAFSGPARLPV